MRIRPVLITCGFIVACDGDSLFRLPPETDGGAVLNAPGTVPAEAGSYLYFWTVGSDAQQGRIARVNLQGTPEAETVWPRSDAKGGPACAGCHSVSPNGRYLALTESTMNNLRFRVMDLGTGEPIGQPIPEGAAFAA